MTELERYLAEEIAEDHVDGIINRREALRRLALLGVGATAAVGMITAEAEARTRGKNSGGDKHGGHGHGHGHPDRAVTAWAPAATQAITFPGPRGNLMGAWAPSAQQKVKGGVLVIHENRGLTPHIANVAGRFAANGFSALALDLLSEEGGTGAFPDEAALMAKLSEISANNPTRFDEDMKAALTELGKRAGRHAPLSAIGFCFGGGMIWRLLVAKEKRLSAAAPFYGPFPTGGDVRGIKADVLGVFAGVDDRVNATREAARAALEAARVDYEILTFTEAQHAFFNDTNPARFNAQAAAQAWLRVNDWFGHDKN
ncbi:dienelactone hydrolase family protein [Solirubrobacter taibaiensis]|nr:dienelactone hydrolase family protein [Solirubrobacter taibaiensis]